MSSAYTSRTWYTLKEAGEALGLPPGKLRRLIEEQSLLAVRHDGEPRIPVDFVQDGEPLPGLRGTLILLADCGITGHEAMEWLLSPDDALGEAPVDALRAGRKTRVRHSVQLLAL